MTVIRPQWNVPKEVRALVTTRQTGNMAMHVGDPVAAQENRRRLVRAWSLPGQPHWLEQVHGNDIHVASDGPAPERPPVADAAYTREYNKPLVVMVADCLPVFLASSDEVAVVHAGWRGLANGIIGRTVARFRERDQITAWLGPAIGPCHYEVDDKVKSSFEGMAGFRAGREGHYMMDLWELARRQLAEAGVRQVDGGGVCTWCDPQYYSHRQDAAQARFAAIIWRDGGIF